MESEFFLSRNATTPTLDPGICRSSGVGNFPVGGGFEVLLAWLLLDFEVVVQDRWPFSLQEEFDLFRHLTQDGSFYDLRNPPPPPPHPRFNYRSGGISFRTGRRCSWPMAWTAVYRSYEA